jgi:wyosine [tRNA(Phe)-imidazoG37] synthetase (radical SAM superfamily)
MRGFKSNRGTIKGPKDMSGKICLRPFTNIDIHSDFSARVCGESWMPAGIGDYSKSTVMEMWNGDIAVDIRRSILDGSYRYCDWHQCPLYSNDVDNLYTIDELISDNYDITIPKFRRLSKLGPWIAAIERGETFLNIMPANYNLAYDETCNLKCPSCRSYRKNFFDGPEYRKAKLIHEKLISEIEKNKFENIRRLNLTGSGEPFASRIFRDFLFNFDGTCFPNLDINIQSNGLLFNSTVWRKMHRIHANFNEVYISIDAATSDTYKKIRVHGDFIKLLDNIAFLADLRRKGEINLLYLAFVVQRLNYQEMRQAIELTKYFGADLIIFNLLNDWGSWSNKEYERNAVWKKDHPEFQNFLNELSHPIFDANHVDLGNMKEYREKAKRIFK